LAIKEDKKLRLSDDLSIEKMVLYLWGSSSGYNNPRE